MSHEHGRKGVYGIGRDRIRDREMELPVPNYRGDRSMPMKRTHSLNDLEKRCSQASRNVKDDNYLSEIYDFSELKETSKNIERQDSRYSAAPPTTIFKRDPGQSHGSKYQASVYNGLPGTALASQQPPDMASRQLNPQQPQSVLSNHNLEDHSKREAIGQKVAPLKQVEDYKKKAVLLRQELDTLKNQRNELRGDGKRSPSPETKRFLKDNAKLQLEIQNKLNTINNVLDMLNDIIGEQTELCEPEESPDRKRKSRSPSGQKFNYVYYDPEMHWCRVCNEFPPTAKDYLNHLHSVVHQKMAAEHTEAPWHCIMNANEGYPSFPSAPTKRTPIKGLQFFVPATAWYCKLCDQFIGDLHCASAHIKSIVHSKNYSNFVEHNPHWETDWMSDRQKALEKARSENKLKPIQSNKEDNTSCSVKYTSHTISIRKDFQSQQLQKSSSPDTDANKKYKKKRKRNRRSSQSSVSDTSENEICKEKKPRNKKLLSIEMSENKASESSNSPTQDRLSEDERKLLESLKSRMKRSRDERQSSISREIERIKVMQQRIRESELRGRSSENRGDIRDRRDDPRDRRDDPRDRRDDPRDRRDDPRERWNDRRDRRVDSRDRKLDSRDRRLDSRDRRPDSRDEQTDRRHDSQDRSEDSRDRREDSHNRRANSRIGQSENQEERDDSQAAESKEQAGSAQPPLLPLPLPLPATLPLPTALPSVALPPVVMPPPQSLLPPPAQSVPSVSKEFQEALEILFPTDPQKCTEMLNAIQQQQQKPSLLGIPPPSLGMPFPPLGLMQPPGMFGFDPTALFSPPPLLPMMPGAHLNKPRQNRNIRTKPDRARPTTSQPRRENGDAAPDKNPELDELMMLGIDASDVGARI